MNACEMWAPRPIKKYSNENFYAATIPARIDFMPPGQHNTGSSRQAVSCPPKSQL